MVTWCLNSFCSSIQFQSQDVFAVRDDSWNQRSILSGHVACSVGVGAIHPTGLGDSCRPSVKATLVCQAFSWCQHINSTNGSKPCKTNGFCAGKRGMPYSLFISSVRDWDTCHGHLRIKNLRYFFDIIQQGCSPASDVHIYVIYVVKGD